MAGDLMVRVIGQGQCVLLLGPHTSRLFLDLLRLAPTLQVLYPHSMHDVYYLCTLMLY